MRGTLFTLILVACSVASAATTVYKWVDENGVIHYSDQPHDNAAKLEVREPTTYSPKTGPAAAVRSVEQAAAEGTQGPYQSCSLAQPTPEQVFLSAYSVTVMVNTSPALRPGDRVVVTLDGRPLTNLAGASTSITINPIDRGTHSVEATIQDPSGQPVCTTASSTFYVRQPSLLSPQHQRH
jgi:hypothetical protein